jgi:hypothetical protein
MRDHRGHPQKGEFVENRFSRWQHLARRELEKEISRPVEVGEWSPSAPLHQLDRVGRDKIFASGQHGWLASEKRISSKNQLVTGTWIAVDPVVSQDMWRGDQDGRTVLRRRLTKSHRLVPAGRTIIDSGQAMKMNVNHADERRGPGAKIFDPRQLARAADAA